MNRFGNARIIQNQGGFMNTVKPGFKSIALACGLLIGLSACSKRWLIAGAAVAAAGAGTYAYIKGDLQRTYQAPMDKAWDATLKAVNELKMAIESQQHDAFNGTIKGSMADSKNFQISLKRLTEESTEIGVRIGLFGDRQISEAIHEKIMAKLSAG
jgi:hypothetical protein